MMEPDRVLIVSGCAAKDGGLFAVDGNRVEVIDRLKTHGLSLRSDALYRLVSCNHHALPRTDLFVYDFTGVRVSYRLDGVWDAHDVLARERDVLVVCSGDDSVYALTPDGTIDRWWTAGSRDGDRHLNCLSDFEGVVATELGWWKHDPDAATGRLFRLPSEEIICEGLSQPHTPRFIDGVWVVANSRRRALQAYDPRGTLLEERTFAGFTRGLEYDESYLYLGESTERVITANSLTSGRITILDRETWEVVDTISLPTSNVYDVVLAPRALVNGLRTGFRRDAEFADDYAAAALRAGVRPSPAWAIADPLPAASLGARIDLQPPPRRLQVDEMAIVHCKITNTGAARYVSAPPNPIVLCYRWYDDTGSAVGAGTWLHSPLPEAIGPGETIDAAMRISAPDRAGNYTIAITLLQEGVAWFDDLNPAFGIRAAVAVAEA